MDRSGQDSPPVGGGADLPPPTSSPLRSRRVAIGAGSAAAAVAVLGGAAALAQRAGILGRGPTIRVNGSEHQVRAEPATPLLYVLRNEVGLQDVRFGCGMAECGACTVQVDGKAVRSCVTPVSAVAGR